MNPHATLIELEQNIEKLTNIYKTNAAKLSRQSSLDFNEYTVNPLLRAMQELLKEYRARYDQHREQINELEKQNQYKDFVNNNQALDLTRLEKLITELRSSTNELMDGFNKERAELQKQNANLQDKLIDLEHKIRIKESTIRRLINEKQELVKLHKLHKKTSSELLAKNQKMWEEEKQQLKNRVNELENLLGPPKPITREMLKQIEQEHSHKYENAQPEPCTFEELVGEPMKEQVTWTINNIIYREADISDIGKMVYFTNININNALQNPKHKLINVDHDQRFPYLADTNIGYTKAYIEIPSSEQTVQLGQPTPEEPNPIPCPAVIISSLEQTKFSTGAVRSTDANSTRYDLISPVGLRRIAETYAEGAKKYGDNNWQKGMPASDTMNHAIRHINLWLSGDKTEDHLAHAAWNLIAIMHFEELKPECIDVPTRRTT